MTAPLTTTFTVDFGRKQTSRPGAEEGEFQSRLPRVTRLMALAIRFDKLLRDKTVRDYAHLARLGRVTRARMTQIMSLLNLDVRIQEELLFLEPVAKGRDPVILRDLLPVTIQPTWSKQRAMWRKLAKN
ncbi:hypothetical protein [Zavarzinella formosa]|uniref:hypothetical protein n=1 Tax=Zavarzinella formosa TaxID=360055 RepID=UPI000301307D|nr:hypothetical protein [Zavarzinella formosa]